MAFLADQSKSCTSPTGSTQTANYSVHPGNRNIAQSNFPATKGREDMLAGVRQPHGPFRPAMYQQDWSGVATWQSWDSLGGFINESSYPIHYRQYVSKGNAEMASQLILSRNQPMQYAPAPIAISQYALNTQQVYVGSDYAGGSY